MLEISCGEAPFLASRYDTTTGEWINVNSRIGALDRKLRVINENCNSEQDWYNWTLVAFKSTFGYEWQGDSLLIARENLLFTFIDYYIAKFGMFPIREYLIEIAKILSWNIWQMDGLKNVIPNSCKPVQKRQMSLFEDEETELCLGCAKNDNSKHTGIYSRIMNWETKRSIKFFKGEKRMKFDFVIGNPPYQETVAKKETNNGQKRTKSIFHYFQNEADKITKISSCLIYPAMRWIHRSGKGMSEFGLKQINDVRLKNLTVYEDATELFPSTEIADGISIVLKDYGKENNGFNYSFRINGKELTSFEQNPGGKLLAINPAESNISFLLDEFVKKYKIKFLYDSVLSQKLFGIESDFVEKNGKLVKTYDSNYILDNNEIKLFTNDKAGKAGRAKWYVTDRSNIKNNQNLIDEYQVIVSSASPAGQKRDNQVEIIDNKSAFGRSRVALSTFKTLQEAQNFYKYVNSFINQTLDKYYDTFSHTLDTNDFVPEKFNKKISKYIFKNMKKAFKRIDKEDRKYQRQFRKKVKAKNKEQKRLLKLSKPRKKGIFSKLFKKKVSEKTSADSNNNNS